ncbi:MAG: ABC transporter permease [Nanobdellota archaeon]
MKFLEIIKKNFKVLFRQKTSLVSIVLGPILIIFLIGLAFSSSTSLDIVVGIHSPENTSLSNEFVDVVESNNYSVKSFPSNSSCIDELKKGLVHTCIIFPKDFVIRQGKTNELEFFVDESRMNIVYTVINKVSDRLEIKTDELSKSLTQDLILAIEGGNKAVDDALADLISVRSRLSTTSNTVLQTQNELENINYTFTNVNFGFSSDIMSLESKQEKMEDTVMSTVSQGLDLIDSIETQNTNPNITSDIESLKTKLTDLNSSVKTKSNASLALFTQVITEIEETRNEVNSLEEKLEDSKTATENSVSRLSSLDDSLQSISSKVQSIKQSLESASLTLNDINIKSSDQIVNPVTTDIKTVSTSNKIGMLFPYVLILVIMFVGFILSSTLVVLEKKSKASFKIFTTPSKDILFILSTFATSFIVVIVQTIIILSIAGFFGVNFIESNILLNSIILLLSTSMFIFLGMALGYLFPNQQSSNMASISLGAIFLFISNLVLPLESISPALQRIAEYNPYVLSSETLRQSIIFSLELKTISQPLIIMAGYCIAIFIIVFFIQKIAKIRLINKSHLKYNKEFHPSILQYKGKKISSQQDFISLLTKMSAKEYKLFRIFNKRKILQFIDDEIHNDELSKQIYSISKEKVLQELVEHNEKRIKKIQREQLNEKNKR